MTALTPPPARRARRLTSGALVAALAVAGVLTAAPAHAAEPDWVTDPASYVNTLDGTGIGGDVVGSINNFPGATVPFGMTQFSPDSVNTYAGYQYHNDRITGFSMNHASAGCNVFGDIPVLPWNEDIGLKPWDAAQHHDDKEHVGESGRPGYYTVPFTNGIVNELTATDRGGLIRATYPEGKPATFMVRPGGSLAGNSAADLTVVDDRTVTGSATTGNFCGKGNSYTIYFSLVFDQPFTTHGTWDREAGTVTPGSDSVSSRGAGGYFTFPDGTTQVQAKISVSYVSVDGARNNMATEQPGFDFDGTSQRAYDRWNEALSRIRVAGTQGDDLRGFYTSLYRSLLHPNIFDDVDGRYIGFDGAIHTVDAGTHHYANFSDWDTYRTLIPLQTMLFPDIAADMAESLVRDAEQSGSLPRWPVANSATGQMTGDNVTALIGQIHAFGGTDFDAQSALSYMVSAADNGGEGLRGYVQRPGAAIYNESHYAPQVEAFRGDHQIVGGSITLEWSVDDFVISRLAASLGDDETAARFQARSSYWQNLFDPAQNAIAPRNSDGSFLNVSDQGHGFGQAGFDEGNAEQYLWMVPQNMAGLADALGGRESTAARLDTFTGSTLNSGGNKPLLWAGNEPNFLVPWAYNYLGQPWKSQQLVDRIRTELFSPGPDGSPGNDDLGALSSWYVWASIGLVPATPGTPVLALNTPAFDHVSISLKDGQSLRVDAPGASSGMRYIAGMSVDGATRESLTLPESAALTGGAVALTLADAPAKDWAVSTEAAPPSFGEDGTGFAFAASQSLISTTAGTQQSVDLVARRFDSDLGDVKVSATSSAPGITATAPTLAVGDDGALRGPLTISVGASVPDGYYPVTVIATAGSYTRTQSLTVQVAAEGGLVSLFDLVGTSTEASRGGANFDNAGNSYAREELAKNGLTPGAAFTVGDLTATWPGAPAGAPDMLKVGGQTIAVPNEPTSISFVGGARDGGAQLQATVTFDDNSTATIPFALGDWVLPFSGGSTTPVFGNSVVARQEQRHSFKSGPDGSYVVATAPYTAPAGRTISSVTLPSGSDADKLRLIAIASNGVAPQPTQTVLQSTAFDGSATATEGQSFSFEVTASTPVDGTIEVFEDAAPAPVTARAAVTAAAPAPVATAAMTGGSATVVLPPAPVGEHAYRLVLTPADASAATGAEQAFSVTVTAASTGGGTDPGAGGTPGGATSPEDDAGATAGTGANRLGATGGDLGTWLAAGALGLALTALGIGLTRGARRREEV